MIYIGARIIWMSRYDQAKKLHNYIYFTIAHVYGSV